MTGSPHLKVFGFPVYFRVSALLAAGAAVIFLREIGAIIAGVLAISILVHELGHSFAFRRYGTESHIVVHLMGGYSAPDRAHKLNHREWVITSLAGPLLAFFVLGAPAWLLREFTDMRYGYAGVVLNVLVYFNIYWGALNLLPIWPLDGGRVLYHATSGNWDLTKTVTLAASVPAAIIAYQLGYRFAMFLVLFNAYQIYSGPGPAGTGMIGNSRIDAAVKEAKRYAPKPTKTRGEAGVKAVETVYQELLRGRPDRAAEPLAALRKSKFRSEADIASAWGALLAGNQSDLPSASLAASPLLAAVAAGDPFASAHVLRQGVTIESTAALRVLHQRGLLDVVCGQLGSDEAGIACLRQLERHTLDLGMFDEQVRVTASLPHA